MGLKEVKDDVIREAENEAEQLKKEAEERKEEILEEAREEAEKIREEAEQEIEDDKESLRRKKLSNARMKAKKLKLERKRDYIQKTFENFRHELEKMDQAEREEFVKSCIDRTAFEIGEVRASEDFQDAVKDEGFTPEDLDKEGLVLISENGEKRQEFTLDKIVEDYRNNHRKLVAEELFG